MNMNRVIDILKTEKECVERNCNRDCADCDLVLDDKEILQAYTLAIGCIEGNMNEQQPNWIPCSERLPEDSDDVLITYVFDYGKSCPDDIKALLESDEGAYVLFNPKKVWEMPHITIAHYYDGTEDGEPSEWCYDNECYSMPEEVRVIAWMPLPEPYMED